MAAALSRPEASESLALLADHAHVGLAVSGGPDSLALLHLVAGWLSERTDRPRVSVLTVDHGLRAGARAEALMVARVASELGLPHAILEWTRPKSAAGGLQAEARRARYDLMASYCHAHGIEAIVTAHHLDDQAETFLMRLKRGSGLDGLAAIPEHGTWAGIALLRPFLAIPKARLAATLTASGLAHVVDPSNEDQRFERVRIRADRDVFAQLGLTPESLARSALRLRRAREALEAAASEFLAANAASSEAGYVLIERKPLAEAPDEIALRVLRRGIEAVGGMSEPLRLAKIEALLDLLKSDPAKTRTLGGCRLSPCGESLGVFREMRKAGLPALRLAPGMRALWDNRFRVELGGREGEPVTVRAVGQRGWQDLRTQASPWLNSVPRLAGMTLPACWRGDEMLFFPTFNHAGRGADMGFHAHFVGRMAIEPRQPWRKETSTSSA